MCTAVDTGIPLIDKGVKRASMNQLKTGRDKEKSSQGRAIERASMKSASDLKERKKGTHVNFTTSMGVSQSKPSNTGTGLSI